MSNKKKHPLFLASHEIFRQEKLFSMGMIDAWILGQETQARKKNAPRKGGRLIGKEKRT